MLCHQGRGQEDDDDSSVACCIRDSFRVRVEYAEKQTVGSIEGLFRQEERLNN